MKWKIRLARDMAQEAFVVIDAPTSEEAEAILWQDMDPDVIRWPDDDLMGDREVREVYPADDKEALTPLEVPPVRQPKALKTYRVTWVIEVEADTPLSAARRARSWQTQPGTVTYEVYEVCLCPAERCGPPVTIDLTPDARLSPTLRDAQGAVTRTTRPSTPSLICNRFQINRRLAPTRRMRVRTPGQSRCERKTDPMMIIEDQEHLDKVREFARCVGAEAELQKQLDFLAGFGGDAAKVRCHLYRDFAPHSFFWRMEHSSLDGWKPGLVGGLIYSGPDIPSDRSAPSFSVSLNPDAASGRKHMWSIHT